MGVSARFTRTTRSSARRQGTALTARGTALTARGTAPTAGGTAPTRHGNPPAEHPHPAGMLVLGRYRLHRPLGAGGFGSVWLALDERLERDVAVKVLPRERVIGGRFEREARATARLSHPAIVTLYEAAVDDDGAYLVSELVRGSTLGHLLEAGRLSDRDIVAIGIALCDALEHAHAQGVVHRDVKPSNVLVPDRPSSSAGVAKLADFGVARLIGGRSLTRTGDIVGTAGYMAPEQADGLEADGTADLYSVALVLYEALTGVNPIATSAAAGRARRLGAHLPPLRRHRRDLPRELGRTIDLALRPLPRERGTIAELRSGLVASLDHVEDVPGVVEPPWPRSNPATLSPASVEAPHRWAPPGAWPEGDGQRPRPERDAAPMQSGFRPQEPPSPPPWPNRAAATAAAALIAAWLTGSVLSSSPMAPAGAALVACLAVIALPRIGWLFLTLAAVIILSVQGSPGAALIVLLGASIPIVLLPHRSTRWPLAALAPALGVALIAGAWPALAGYEKTAWRRAALGAIGWVWIILAGLLTGHALYARLPPASAPRSVWIGSVDQAVGHVLSPLVGAGLLAPAVIWALAAAALPWMMRGSTTLRLGLIAAWSAALAAATAAALPSTAGRDALTLSRLVLGAAAAWLIAAAPVLIRRAQSASLSPDPAPDLA